MAILLTPDPTSRGDRRLAEVGERPTDADRAKVKRINDLIAAVMRDPFAGIGKPEPLKHELAGSWSRRIDDEDRLVYRVSGDDVIILQARYQY